MAKRAKKETSTKGNSKSVSVSNSIGSQNVGQLIKAYREKQGITQKALSDYLGYDNPQFISLIENGHSKVPLNALGKVIAALNIPEKKIIDSLLNTYEQEIRSEIGSVSKKKSS